MSRAYILSYSGILSIHLMRTSFPFVNDYVMKSIEVDEEFIGMALGLSYFAGGIACIFHLFMPFTNYALAYSGNVGLGSTALIPTCLFMGQGE